MPRPRKIRCVESVPGTTYFKPRGIPLHFLEEIILSVEEIEAIRLKDIENLDGEEAAERMKISRPTFQRVLDSARKKIADGLVNGKALRIEGGNYQLISKKIFCRKCRYELNTKDEGCCPICQAVINEQE